MKLEGMGRRSLAKKCANFFMSDSNLTSNDVAKEFNIDAHLASALVREGMAAMRLELRAKINQISPIDISYSLINLDMDQLADIHEAMHMLANGIRKDEV